MGKKKPKADVQPPRAGNEVSGGVEGSVRSIERKSSGENVFLSEFSRRLQDLVEKKFGARGLSQLAAKVSTNESTLRNYVSGRSLPGLEIFKAIVDATGVNSEWLMRGEGPMFPTPDPAAEARRQQVEQAFRDAVTTATAASKLILSLSDFVKNSEFETSAMVEAAREMGDAALRVQRLLDESLARKKQG